MRRLLLFLFTLIISSLVTLDAAPSNKSPISLIWQVNKDVHWEADWIAELLSGINYNESIDGQYKMFKDYSIIVTTAYESHKGEFKKYFNKLNKKKYIYGVIFLCDELYGGNTEPYKSAKFIFRNYWHKKFAEQKNVFFFALGYKVGFWKNIASIHLKDSTQRKYTWSFAGQIVDKPSRILMIDNMKTIPQYFFFETFKWSDPNALPVGDYRDVLLESVFVPCPKGWWNLDSFRLSEALECGCIPIVEKDPFDYFARFFGEYPFLSVSSWNEAPAMMKQLLDKPEELEALRLRCYHWWLDYKTKLKKDTAQTITDNFKS